MKTQVRTVIDKITDEKSKQVLTTNLGNIQRQEVTLKGLTDFIESMTMEEENVLDKSWKYSIKFDDNEEI